MNTQSRFVPSLCILACVAAAAPAPAGPCEVAPHPSWKNTLEFPQDPFVVDPAPNPRWVKFTVLACDPERVYFQDSGLFPFHYDFAVARLDPFRGMSRAEFDAATLRLAGQIAVLGAVILPPSRIRAPSAFGIQLAGRDPYPPEKVVDLFRAVTASIGHAGASAYYFPAFEQQAAAEANAEFLASNGVLLGSTALWAEDNEIYAEGWALGRLKFVAAAGIRDAYFAGELRPADILLTDGVPAEVPFVAGILSLRPATPNSHVAILARSYGVPFAHLLRPADAARARELDERSVVVTAFTSFFGSELRLIDVEGRLSAEIAAEILALKELPPLRMAPIRPAGAYALPAAELDPGDIGLVGGKAANYGFLLRSIPANSRPAVAFTFDLWSEFLSQELANGRSLREEIDLRLAPFASYPPADFAGLAAALDGVRRLFREAASSTFSPALRQAVLEALQDPRYGFDPARKLRVRSSSNVEDGEQFTGAGLYDSFSGCLLDDLDADDLGPSHCDPAVASERGIFRAIRRVFASFYNDNAFLERRRWRVVEAEAGMALLVHHSFPDDIELANGVATLARAGSSYEIEMVSQVGAVSVANPEDGSLPESVRVTVFSGGGIAVELVRESNLLPLGANVLEWRREYESFAALFVAAAKAFEAHSGKTRYSLDYEYKKIAPADQLIVKQVREIPLPDAQRLIAPFLIDEPLTFETFQGEAGDVFANHRLKSTWRFESKNLRLTEENLRAGIFERLEVEFSEGCEVRRFAGPVSALTAVEQGFAGNESNAFLRWRFDELANPRACELEAGPLPLLVSASRSPFVTLRDLHLGLEVTHRDPVLGWTGLSEAPAPTRRESIVLALRPAPRDGDLEQARMVSMGGVSVTTRYFWPPPPEGIIAGYTAPLIRWVETVIEGLTSEPIVLRGERSQSYRPEHHNFDESFIFAPHEEEGLPPELLAELEARDVRWLRMTTGKQGERLELYGACELLLACACGGAPPRFRRGDCNDDGRADISDPICALGWLFIGGKPPGCLAVLDTNGDGRADISDAVYLLTFLFQGGPPPAAPFPGCGSPAGGRELGCEAPPASCRG